MDANIPPLDTGSTGEFRYRKKPADSLPLKKTTHYHKTRQWYAISANYKYQLIWEFDSNPAYNEVYLISMW